MPNAHRMLSRMRIFAGTEYRHFKGIPGRVLRVEITCFKHMMPSPPRGGMNDGTIVSNIGFGVAHESGMTGIEYTVIHGVIADPILWLCGVTGTVDGVMSSKTMRREIAPIQYTEPDGYNLCA